jgi:hypothetical protein
MSILINYNFVKYYVLYTKKLIDKLDKFMISDNALIILILIRIYNLDHYITYFLMLPIISKYYRILCLLPNINRLTKYYISMFYIYSMSVLLTILF